MQNLYKVTVTIPEQTLTLTVPVPANLSKPDSAMAIACHYLKREVTTELLGKAKDTDGITVIEHAVS